MNGINHPTGMPLFIKRKFRERKDSICPAAYASQPGASLAPADYSRPSGRFRSVFSPVGVSVTHLAPPPMGVCTHRAAPKP